ncbi:MAG: response regulator [Chthoniobacteraceae bacterium]
MAPGDAYPVFTVILAVLAGILGLSASLLYRHMHQRVEDLRHRADNAEAELRALLMLTDEAVLILAFDGTVRAANPASEEVFNRDADQIVGEPLTAVIAQPLALSELTKHGPVNFQTTAKRGKDDFAQVEMLLSPVEMTTGKGYLAVVHRTSEIFPEDPVKRTKRKDDVQGAIEKFTHDLNNQLTSVLGHLSLALMARPGDPATHQRVLDAKKTAIRAQSLSAEMQAFIHPDHDEPHSTATTTAMPDMNCTILPMPIMTPPAKLSSDRKPGPTRLLILDDEEAICMLVSSVLGASGFEVTSAYSVATALQATQDAMEAGTPFSLAICDLSLPGDTDGVQALKQLQAIDPSLKAIVSSGYDSDAVMRDCRKFGFCASMSKPYDIGRLMRIVSQVLAGDGVPLLKTA